VTLGLARALILTVPFRWLARRLGPMNEETPYIEETDGTLRRVALAMRTVSRHTPWNSNCLAQALAGKVILSRRGLQSTLYLGVAKDGERMEAHAWLRCGSAIVTGAAGKDRYTVVSTFGGGD
jgi:hypothetical protein